MFGLSRHTAVVRVLLVFLLLVCLFVPLRSLRGQEASSPLKVVATFSIIGDMVKVIGGNRVDLVVLLGPDGDMHTYEPTPRDVQAISTADIVFANGLNFETWLNRVVESASYKGELVTLTQGITPRLLTPQAQRENQTSQPLNEAENNQDQPLEVSDIDPHAWQSLKNGIVYAKNVRDALSRIDPRHAREYRDRAAKYIEQMERLDQGIWAKLASISPEKRLIITAHDAFGYFGQEYGLRFMALMGLSSEAEPSAGELAALVEEIKQHPGAVVFSERSTNPRLVEQIARETGAKVGGVLYSDALGNADEPGGTYLGMMSWNAGQIIYGFNPADVVPDLSVEAL